MTVKLAPSVRSLVDIEHQRQVHERNEILSAVSSVDAKLAEHIRTHTRAGWLQSAVIVAALGALGTVGAKWVEARATASAIPPASLAAQDNAYRQLAEDVRHVEARLSERIVAADTLARAVADEVERRELQRPIQGTKRR